MLSFKLTVEPMIDFGGSLHFSGTSTGFIFFRNELCRGMQSSTFSFAFSRPDRSCGKGRGLSSSTSDFDWYRKFRVLGTKPDCFGRIWSAVEDLEVLVERCDLNCSDSFGSTWVKAFFSCLRLVVSVNGYFSVWVSEMRPELEDFLLESGEVALLVRTLNLSSIVSLDLLML